MLGKLVLPEIRELIELGDDDTLRDVVNRWHPADLGQVASQLSPAEQLRVMRLLEPRLAAETFEYLDLETQLAVLGSISELGVGDHPQRDGSRRPDRAAGRAFSRAIRAAAGASQSRSARDRRRLLTYGENSVGRLMTPDFVSVHKEWTLRHVLDHVRAHGRDSETLNVIYVVNGNNRLIDDLRIREILLAPLHAVVSDLCDNRFVSLNASDDKKEAVKVFRQYDRTVLPVIDSHGRLVGIVTLDDVLDVAEEEATREIQKFGGLEALDEPYMSTPLLEMIRKRASWLVILFVGEMLTATAMGYFEHEISRAVVLALFVPLIISSGGNSGSQAATLIIRALALGEVKLRDWWRVMRREVLSGLLLGLILGTIGFVRIALWSAFSSLYGEHWMLVGLTVSCSLLGIVLWGTITGSMLPFILKWLGMDPATSSAPFVATLVDVTGLIIYFSVALVILHGTLL